MLAAPGCGVLVGSMWGLVAQKLRLVMVLVPDLSDKGVARYSMNIRMYEYIYIYILDIA